MKRMRMWLRRAFTSVTIMVIPHGGFSSLNLRVPLAILIVTLLLAAVGGSYVLGLAVHGMEYKAQNTAMAEKVRFYSKQFSQWGSTVESLRAAEYRFRRLFSLGSKEEVLENVDTASIGTLEVPDLIAELKKTAENVEEIKNYIEKQRDVYVATPKGYPAAGIITSPYGKRMDPFSGNTVMHTGVDISCNSRTPIRATADGVVSHSGWTDHSGYVVILEHGCGFSTVYAHNSRNTVKVGSRVKRGDIVGYVGSTGKSTGPHVHYEVWRNGKTINALQYLPKGA